MKIGSAFPGSYLKADELGRARPVVTIRTVKMEDIGSDTKPVLYFDGKEKGLVLNKTNSSMITEIIGSDETEHWTGHQVQLYVTKVDFQGKRVDAIRVMQPQNGRSAPAAPPPPPQPPPPVHHHDEPSYDDDVPF